VLRNACPGPPVRLPRCSGIRTERAALPAGDPERRAAELTEAHADTPATAHLDALGRPFLQVDHNRDELGADVFAETRLLLDTVGNVLQVTDARGNVAEAREHGLLRQALRVTSEDAGERRMLRTVLGEPFRSWNSRGFVTTLDYDAARRPRRTIITRPDASTFTAVRMVYGESVPSPQAQNLRGQVFRVYDGAGLQQSDAFDFKGNLVSQSRQLTAAYDGTPSWSALDGLTTIDELDAATAALLEPETFTTTATFDALGRPVAQTTPDASVTHLGYDDGGKLYQPGYPRDFVPRLSRDLIDGLGRSRVGLSSPDARPGPASPGPGPACPGASPRPREARRPGARRAAAAGPAVAAG
jgi:YD repeat-containing protein